MNAQINLRLPESLLVAAKSYAEKHGFGTLQELLKETLREKLFEPAVSKQELTLIKRLAEASMKKNLFGTEEELFRKLKKRGNGIHS